MYIYLRTFSSPLSWLPDLWPQNETGIDTWSKQTQLDLLYQGLGVRPRDWGVLGKGIGQSYWLREWNSCLQVDEWIRKRVVNEERWNEPEETRKRDTIFQFLGSPAVLSLCFCSIPLHPIIKCPYSFELLWKDFNSQKPKALWLKPSLATQTVEFELTIVLCSSPRGLNHF